MIDMTFTLSDEQEKALSYHSSNNGTDSKTLFNAVVNQQMNEFVRTFKLTFSDSLATAYNRASKEDQAAIDAIVAKSVEVKVG